MAIPRCSALSGGELSLRRVAHRFDVVAIGIEHEGAVLTGMIVGADAGRAIIASARGHRRLVEGVDRGAIPG